MLDYVGQVEHDEETTTAAAAAVEEPGKPSRPVVTYSPFLILATSFPCRRSLTPGPLPPPPDFPTTVSRQNWNRRKLDPSSHASLLVALERAAAEDGWELVVVDMERLTLEEQVVLAGRTDVLMGVHGNGRSPLLPSLLPVRHETNPLPPPGFSQA